MKSKGRAGQVAILAQKVRKQYPGGTEPALEDFSLHVEQGEFFGLLGPNGAGKTTAVSILCGLFPPDSGLVRIMGLDVCSQGRAVKALSGLVPQDLALYEGFTVSENLRFFGRLYGLGGRRLQRRIDWCLELAALADHGDRLVKTCSGGMKRRLNLVAGLLNEPDILFLDEPTVGIDAQSRNLIHEQLLRLKDQGATIIYTTHYMAEAMELCDRIGIVDHGRLVAEGPPGELLQRSSCDSLEALFLHLTGRQLRDS